MYPILESIFVGVATFAIGTLVQAVDTGPAAIVATIAGLTYLGISEVIDAHCHR
ncbi:hypothetical protein [Rhizobium leguminosarum]